ncbi:AAA family ATPase [Nocardioides sp. MAHUQ-72]|uniref:AAA family ATPase n=1 Tax=unclassified Nocardioides TaxID=2615069 RepID=UPI003609F1E5
MIVVLVVAAGAAWESRAVQLLNERPGIVVLKRCVDVDDLLAAATAGQAGAAVLGLDAPGLDLTATDHLRRHGVRPVAVVPAGVSPEAARLRATRIGLPALVEEADLATLPDVLAAPDQVHEPVAPPVEEPVPSSDPSSDPSAEPPGPAGRVIAVWGPAGAPGRTTLATGLAAELGRRRLRTLLVDADPYGGAVAQQLGVLDEVSGLLSAARLAASGQLAERFASVQRGIDAHLSVITGLPRPDRWKEIRVGALEHTLETAREHGLVVVDTGFSLEEEPAPEFGSRPGRNQMTLAALEVADEVVVVGSADPVGLSRLARGLVELRDLTGGAPVRVVVNRMRPSLGWSENDIAGMVTGFARVSGLHFLPDDRATVDRALVAGRTLTEVGDSPLGRAVTAVADALAPGTAAPTTAGNGRVRRRTAGRARPR